MKTADFRASTDHGGKAAAKPAHVQDSAFLFILRPLPDREAIRIWRFVLLGACLAAAALAAFFPDSADGSNWMRYAVAGLGILALIAAFALPVFFLRRQALVSFFFYADRLEIAGISSVPHVLPYDNIAKVEMEPDARGVVDAVRVSIRLTTHRPAGIPIYGRRNTVVLPGLSAADAPFPRVCAAIKNAAGAAV